MMKGLALGIPLKTSSLHAIKPVYPAPTTITSYSLFGLLLRVGGEIHAFVGNPVTNPDPGKYW
jgi:hypothetical protein